jgi:hypothetical protein
VTNLAPTTSQGGDEAPVALRPLDAAPADEAMPGPSMAGMREIVFPARDATTAAGGAFVQRQAEGFGLPGLPGFSPSPAAGAGSPAGMRWDPGSPGLPGGIPGAATASTAHGTAPAGSPGRAARHAMPVVARSTAPSIPGGSAEPGPGVQRSEIVAAPAAAPVVAPALSTMVQRVDGAAPASTAGTGNAGHSDTELDELARELFGRIRTRLRAEVIHEREAKGLSFDAF